jgi:hypothetical protein
MVGPPYQAHLLRCLAHCRNSPKPRGPGIYWESVLKVVVAVATLAGCGRFGFGLADDGDGDAAVDGSAADAADADAPGMADAPPAMLQHVQQSTVSATVGSHTLVLPAASTAGTLLVIALGANDISNLVLPAGWMIATSVATTGACTAAIAYLPDNPGGITSVMFSQPSLLPTAALLTEWSGIATANPLDAIGTTIGTTASNMQSVQTATPTTTRTLSIDVFCEDVNMPTYTGEPGWTTLGTHSDGPAEPSIISDYRVVAAPGIVGETVTSSANGKHSAAIAAFRSQ